MGASLVEANWWLYLMLFLSIFLLLAINVYVVVIWQHPDDKNEAYLPKAVVVSSGTTSHRRNEPLLEPTLCSFH